MVQTRYIENCLPDGRACQRYPSSKPPSRPLSLASPLSREAQNERALSEAEERAHLSFSDFKRLPRYQVEDDTSSGSDSDEHSAGIVQFAAGDEVRHKSRGIGRVATVCPGFVTVKFYTGETKFYDLKGGCMKLGSVRALAKEEANVEGMQKNLLVMCNRRRDNDWCRSDCNRQFRCAAFPLPLVALTLVAPLV